MTYKLFNNWLEINITIIQLKGKCYFCNIMGVKSHIPNILTLANLFCGILAIKVGFSEHYYLAGFFVLLGAFFDFFDGFSARLLKVQGELGKQLDSFADMVTFGVAPGVVMYSFLSSFIEDSYIPYISFVIPLLSALRLAKFNIDSNQSGKFIGLPTPANALFFVFIPLVFIFESFGWDNTTFVTQSLSVSETFKYLMIVIILLFSYLLNAPIEMIALKFNSFGWKGNEIRFVFLGLCLVVISLSLLISSVFVSVPIIILLYIILSIINNLFKKKQNELQS
jgi:CDP-diacylglycerol--serine O-phosphatidyltransferase